jgi:hypothetical protein
MIDTLFLHMTRAGFEANSSGGQGTAAPFGCRMFRLKQGDATLDIMPSSHLDTMGDLLRAHKDDSVLYFSVEDTTAYWYMLRRRSFTSGL